MMQLIDRTIFATDTVRVGAFRCPVDDPRFRDSGPIEGNVIVFPRRGVWIRQAGSSPVVADPGIVTIYNRGRRYDRAAVSADGDRSDWFSVSPEVAVAIARELDPDAPAEPERAFRSEAAPASHGLYLRQRRLFLAIERQELEPLAIEEAVIALVDTVLRGAIGSGHREVAPLSTARRDLVERAKAELARDIAGPTDLAVLSSRLGASPSHICRVFLHATGLTLHQYRVDLRLRASLETLESPDIGLSRLAAELGFSSHSHFTAMLRRRYGITPTQYRSTLIKPRATSEAITAGTRTRRTG